MAIYSGCVLTPGPWEGPQGIITSWMNSKRDAASVTGFHPSFELNVDFILYMIKRVNGEG